MTIPVDEPIIPVDHVDPTPVDEPIVPERVPEVPERPERPGSAEPPYQPPPQPAPQPVDLAVTKLRGQIVNVGGVDLPPGLSLTIVQDPAGTDAGKTFYLTGRIYGVDMAFEIGSPGDFAALFGGDDASFQEAIDQFDNIERINQAVFDRDFVHMGSSDEIGGSTDSLGSQFEAAMREANTGGLAQWIRESKPAMTLVAVGAMEGWNADKLNSELSKTQAFKQRYKSFATVAAALGTDHVGAVVNQIASMEASIRQSLQRYRGSPIESVSTDYLQALIGSGWSAAEVDQLLSADQRLRQTPGALNNMNELLAHAGHARLTYGRMAQLMAGTAPPDVMDMAGDALRKAALSEQGVEISSAMAAALGDEGEGITDAGMLAGQAQAVAQNVMRFRLELDAGKFGLSRDDILKAAFNNERSGEVNELLTKYGRERSSAAQGFEGTQSFLDDEGNLRVQGLGGL